MGIEIAGVGAYVPARIVTNHEVSQTVDTSDEWIVRKTGIHERRFCRLDEAPSDMAVIAAQRCLDNAGVKQAEVDLIVVACATPDQSQPAVACLVQEKLGIAAGHCPAFDVNSVCAGFVVALNVAQGMMLTDARYKNVLVIGSDAFSKILNWEDRRTCIFFGDGAGAVLLRQTTQDKRIRFRLGSDGRGRRAIEVPAGGTRRPVDSTVLAERLNTFSMDGPRVWNFAVQTVPLTIRQLLSDEALHPSDVDLVVLHQSNLRMIEAIMESLDLPMAQTETTVEVYGNTAAASVPLTLEKCWSQGRLERGDRVVLCGFGGGLSWAAALFEW